MPFWLKDLLYSNFTEFLSIFYFSFLLLISVLSSYKKICPYYILAANQVLSQNFIDIIWRE